MTNAKAGRGWLLGLLLATQFMIIMDAAVVNVALPSIGQQLGLGQAALQWVVSAYALAFGGSLLLGGRAADLFGRRRVFLLGLGTFTLASLAAGLAPSGAALISARAVQGLGGAFASPAALALIATSFGGAARDRALALWGAVGGAGGTAGVLLGGLLTSGPGWPWVFWINVPIGVTVVMVGLSVIPRGQPGRGDLDVWGALTATAGLVALAYGVVSAGEVGLLMAPTLIPVIAAVLLLVAFLWIENRAARTGRTPLVRLDIFKHRSLAAANLLALPVGALPLATNFFLSLYVQNVLGYSPLRAGLSFLPLGLAIITAAALSTVLLGHVGVRATLVLGLLLAASGLFLLTGLPVDGSFVADLLLPQVVVGFGLGLCFGPLNVAAVAGVRPDEAGLASGLISTALQLGGALGLAALFAVAAAGSAGVLERVVGTPTPEVRLESLATGYRAAFAVGSGAALTGALLTLLLLPKARPQKHVRSR